MRPILLASSTEAPGLTFSPVPDSYTANGLNGRPATFTITASMPVAWNWSSSGALPTSNVPNHGTATSITFSLSNSGSADKTANISVSVGTNTWAVELIASGTGLA